MTDSRRRRTTTPTKKRRPHPAAGSRVAALVLSVGAAAGLMASMGVADARSAATADVVALPSPPAPVERVASRPAILLPVPTTRVAGAAPSTTTVTTPQAATLQTIKIQPQRRVVTVKSNGSK